MRGLVVCQFAVTSKNMIEKIKKAASEEDNVYVQCESVANVTTFDFSTFDVVLVAPQVRNYLKLIKELCEPHGIPVEPIDIVAYGMGDAKESSESNEEIKRAKGKK